MSDVTQKLEAIRKKFVGTGEEHDLLGKLTAEYRQAYDQGVKDEYSRQSEKDQWEHEARMFATTICNMVGCASSLFRAGAIDEYNFADVANWLQQSGKTADSLRKIANLMEPQPAPAEREVSK